MLVVLNFTYPIKEKEVIKNDTLKVSSSNIIAPTPTPTIKIDLTSDWYITEKLNIHYPELRNILIVGLENYFNTTELIINREISGSKVPLPPSSFEWSSSNKRVAIVLNGLVTAVSPGVVTISATKNSVVKTYDINIYSSDNFRLVTEVNDQIVTTEININAPISLSSFIIIQDTNIKINLDKNDLKWTSGDVETINIQAQYPYIAVPLKNGKASITATAFGKTAYASLIISEPANINYESKTYYMKVYDNITSSEPQYLQTAIGLPFQLITTFNGGKIINIAPYINWKSTNTNVSEYLEKPSDSVGFGYNTLIAKMPGKVTYTGKYFGQEFTFNIEVTKGTV